VKDNSRLIGWLIAMILALLFLLTVAYSCVSVRVQTGEDNQYEGQTKESTGVESNINKKDSL